VGWGEGCVGVGECWRGVLAEGEAAEEGRGGGFWEGEGGVYQRVLY
jgi:hypothetical protein